MSHLQNQNDGPALVFEASGEMVGIGAAGLVVGRGSGCSLHIPDATVSKQHARLAKEGDHHVLVDLSSTNGTFVNGIQVRSKVLADGDHIRFGMVSFRYRMCPSRVLEPIAPDRRLTRALEAVRKLSTDALGAESERAVQRAVSDFLLEFLSADRVFVALMKDNREGVEVAMIRTRQNLDPKRAVAPVARTPMSRVMKSRKPYCPSASDEDYNETSASMRAASLGSLLVLPLLARGRVLGAIQLERLDEDAKVFDEVDVLVGELAANILSSSIETARLYRFAPEQDALASSSRRAPKAPVPPATA
jgi:pSer/pThr/pTyr-binding forkhead associated (FHA) protein